MDHTVKNGIIASVCFCFVTQDLKSLEAYAPCSWVNILISILCILGLRKLSQRWSVGAKAAVDQPQHCEQNPQIPPPPPRWPPARPGSRWLIWGSRTLPRVSPPDPWLSSHRLWQQLSAVPRGWHAGIIREYNTYIKRTCSLLHPVRGRVSV